VQLADIQKEHKEEEAALRKKVSDNEKKLAGNLSEYDSEMGGIEKQLQEEKGQRLTLVHFPAQLEPFFSLKFHGPPSVSKKRRL
jgi:predicted  nucleic acid-binding Zn-ribbon protein